MATSGSSFPQGMVSSRTRFQSHVRSLSDNASLPSPSSTPSPRRSPVLQHVGSLRAQLRDSPPPRNPARPSPMNRASNWDLSLARDVPTEPQFLAEEREVWGRPSPLRPRKRPSQDPYALQPPQEESPVLQPSKETRRLKAFAPMADIPTVNERPKPSRGSESCLSSPTPGNDNDIDNSAEHEARMRNSRFAEGSMNARCTGISSTWLKHGSISSLSEVQSDNESTPRASPQRSSINLEEAKPPVVTPATFKQRLLKIGSAFKTGDKTSKPEAEANEKKRKGLRKSMSLWNLHGVGEKKKTHDASTSDLPPEVPKPHQIHPSSIQEVDLALMNDRKRRAEEVYAQQYSTKRRKSAGGEQVATINRSTSGKPPIVTNAKPGSTNEGIISTSRKHMQRSSSIVINADSGMSDGHGDIDHHKRPSRRELEKENQQLRAMLNQQQGHNRRTSTGAGIVRSASPSTSLKQAKESEPTSDNSPSGSTNHDESPQAPSKDVPPVPPIPERVALRDLSKGRNQPKNKTNNSSDNSANINPNPSVSGETDTMKRARLLSAGAAGLPRPVSIIVEEDEEGENKSPSPSPKHRLVLEPSSVERMKVKEMVAMQLKGIKREQWEWPDDVF